MNIKRAIQLLAALAIEKHDNDLFGVARCLFNQREKVL
jgi:hypothetical protein